MTNENENTIPLTVQIRTMADLCASQRDSAGWYLMNVRPEGENGEFQPWQIAYLQERAEQLRNTQAVLETLRSVEREKTEN